MSLRIDRYYDLTCAACGKSRSTDYDMGMSMNKELCLKSAIQEGWKEIGGKTVCPECAKMIKSAKKSESRDDLLK